MHLKQCTILVDFQNTFRREKERVYTKYMKKT